MGRCKYGAGIGSSKPNPKVQGKKKQPVAPVAQTVQQPTTLQDLPVDLLQKIFIEHQALKGTDTETYSKQLLLASSINPQVALNKEATAPERIEIYKGTNTPETFSSIESFQQYAGSKKENLVNASFIKMFGRSVTVLIPKTPLLHNIIFIHIQKPGENEVIASLVMKYLPVKGNPLHIALSNVSLKIFSLDKAYSNIDHMTDIIVGSTWLSYIFNIIQRVPTLTFDQKNISVTVMVQNVPLDLSLSNFEPKEQSYELTRQLELILKYVEKRMIQKTLRIGG